MIEIMKGSMKEEKSNDVGINNICWADCPTSCPGGEWFRMQKDAELKHDSWENIKVPQPE